LFVTHDQAELAVGISALSTLQLLPQIPRSASYRERAHGQQSRKVLPTVLPSVATLSQGGAEAAVITNPPLERFSESTRLGAGNAGAGRFGHVRTSTKVLATAPGALPRSPGPSVSYLTYVKVYAYLSHVKSKMLLWQKSSISWQSQKCARCSGSRDSGCTNY
jgi:hypothetical protein